MKCDVLVVGAGPAGSTAAKYLSEKGVNVILLDKKKFPRNKSCGGGIPLRVLDKFNYIRKDWVESYSYSIMSYSSSLKYSVDFKKNEPVLAMIIRKKFDYELVKLAIEKGSTFIEGKTVIDLKLYDDKVTIFLDDDSSIESKILIGADGVFSTVAKKAGLIQKSKNISMCIYEEYNVKKDVLDKFFSEKRVCYNHVGLKGIGGYCWVFPKKEHLNIGVINFSQAKKSEKKLINLKTIYKKYFNLLKECKIIPNDLEIIKLKGAGLPIHPREKTYSDRIILCGDAAGFASPATGEGIFYAMSSGEIAANVVYMALIENSTSEKFLSLYQKKWFKDFGKDLKLLSSFSYLWDVNTEELLRLVSKDKKLTGIVRDIMTGECSINKNKWKMARRYYYVKLKDKFSKKRQ